MTEQEFEKRFLDFVYTTDHTITSSAVAYHTGATIEEASEHLERLASRGVVTLDSDADGNLFYVFPHRTKLAGQPRPLTPGIPPGPPPMGMPPGPPPMGPPPMGPPPPYALQPMARPGPPVHQRHSPGLAAALAACFPGAGHLYTGHVGAGLLWMTLVFISLFPLIFPAMILHGVQIWAAYNTAERDNAHSAPPMPYPPRF